MTLCTPVPEPVFVQMTGLAGLIGLGFRLKRRRA
jgi:hypothetical protein